MRLSFHAYRGFGHEGGSLIRITRLGFVTIETISWTIARKIHKAWPAIKQHVRELTA